MAIDFKALAARAAEVAPDMNKATKGGGGDYTPPAKGLARLRLVAYVECGLQAHTYKGVTSNKDKVRLVFELSGPKHPVKVLEDGTKVPQRITVEETKSLSEKANFYKLFKRLNYTGEATHMAQLLGNEFLGTVVHEEWAAKGNFPARIVAKLRDDAGYTIRAPFVDDPETGETRRIAVDAPLSPLRLFVWDIADKDQWDSLFIDGEYDEVRDEKTGEVIKPARSKNVFQETIRKAANFENSPIFEVLNGTGELDELNDVGGKSASKEESEPAAPTTPPADRDDDDDLNGIV